MKQRSIHDLSVLLSILILTAAGAAVYHNSFTGAFVFDDFRAIVENHTIRSLWPPWTALFGVPPEHVPVRPVVNFSLAINYAVSGLRVWSYHVFNIAVHILAALTLFDAARRTFLLPKLRSRFEGSAPWLSLVISAIWLVHPLQTQSVTYIIQRAEALAGLFYLLTLYCVIRGGAAAKHSGWWCGAAVLSSSLGMASKEIVVTAPFLILIYDRIFLAESFSELARKRSKLYFGLFASWLILGCCIYGTLAKSAASSVAGFGLTQIKPISYALTQTGVILHYLKLAFYPNPLVLDYAWPVAQSARDVLIPLTAISTLLFGTLLLLFMRPKIGFLPLAFFVLLAPTSSIVPIADPIFEHRMYLALAPLTALVVTGFHQMLSALKARRMFHADFLILLGSGIAVAVVAALGLLTFERNRDYKSEFTIWRDTVKKAPRNFRAHSNLAKACEEAGDLKRAFFHATKALELNKNYAGAHNNLGNILAKQGKFKEAAAQYEEALRAEHHYLKARINLGAALFQMGNLKGAAEHFKEALEVNPNIAEAHYNYANVLAAQGETDGAIKHLRETIRLKPELAHAYTNLGNMLMRKDEVGEALKAYERSLVLEPALTEAYANLGLALAKQGNFEAAIRNYKKALKLNPDLTEVYVNLGNVYAEQSLYAEAITFYEAALHFKPSLSSARRNLDLARSRLRGIESSQASPEKTDDLTAAGN